MHHRGILMTVWVCVLSALAASPAQATFPGTNGKIAFASTRNAYFGNGSFDIWVMNPDGSGQHQLTDSPSDTADYEPAWSPDGSRIAFARGDGSGDDLLITNADGSATRATGVGCHDGSFTAIGGISWSPDGSRIAFGCDWDAGSVAGQRIYVADPAGPNAALVASGGLFPDWSPDGTTLAYGADDPAEIRLRRMDSGTTTPVANPPDRYLSQPSWSPDNSRLAASALQSRVNKELYTIKPDGSEATAVQAQGRDPSWSPDGSRIAFVEGSYPDLDLYTVRPDGTGKQLLAGGDGPYTNRDPAWQSLPINSYPRPKGATPIETTLVPAYAKCTAPNRTHGPPLGSESCNPPTQISDELTLGSPDANDKPARATGQVTYQTLPGNPATTTIDEADVRITVELKDVYERQSPLVDYTGELRLRTGLRITDKRNTPHPGGPGAATVSDRPLGTTVACTATADPDQGADCNFVTSADALAPGTVTEGKRSVWGLGQVQVYDGGADGDADTAADNTLFMAQGVFVP